MDSTTKIMDGDVLKSIKLFIDEANKYKRFQINYTHELQQQCIFI